MTSRMNARHGPDAGTALQAAPVPREAGTRWLPGTETTVLVISGSSALHGEVARVCAAAAVGLVIAETVEQSGGRWGEVAAVLMGSDVAGGLPGWRGPTVVVGPTGVAARMWRQASRLGADKVAVLPDSAQWLANYFTRLRDPADGAAVVGVVGGCGGAGASTLSALIAGHAASGGRRVLLVDGDPWGGDLDAAMAADSVPGLRWPDLLQASGAINPEQLAASLPQPNGMSLLSWSAAGDAGGYAGGDGGAAPGAAAAAEAEVMRAAREAFGLVVVDVGRPAQPALGLGMHCDGFVLLVPGRLRAAAAAQRVLRSLPAAPVGLVVAGPLRDGVDARLVADSVGVPLVGRLPRIRGLEEAFDAGRLPDIARHRKVRRVAGGVLAWLAGDGIPEDGAASRARRGP